jgi:hypothetical protein
VVITRLRVTFTDHVAGRQRGVALVLKGRRDGRGWSAHRCAGLLRKAGLDGPRFAVLRTLGVAPDGTLVAEEAPGRPWATRLAGRGGAAAAQAVAAFVVALQRSGAALSAVPAQRPRRRAELTDLLEFAAVRAPGAVDDLWALAECLDASRESPLAAAGLVPSHGDLHPRNVFLAPAAGSQPLVTVIDLDHVGLREPAADVGYAVCQVLVTGWHQGVPPESAAASALLFWQAYRRAGGTAADERITTHVVEAMVQVLHFEHIGFGGAPVPSLAAWAATAARIARDGAGALAAASGTTGAAR